MDEQAQSFLKTLKQANADELKEKVIAGLLGIFLGAIGAHKFYLGKWVQGLIYLFLCWTYIPGIIGFCEGVVYLCTGDEKFALKYG